MTISKKRVLIDGTAISQKMDGLSQYTLNIIRCLNGTLADYTLIVRPNECPVVYLEAFEKQGISIESHAIAPIGPRRDIAFANFLRKRKSDFDCAFIPSNQYPLALDLPAIYTIHDLIYESFPEQLGKLCSLKRWYLHHVIATGLRKATYVTPVSAYTAIEIEKYHPTVNNEKFKIIHEGYEHLTQLEEQKPAITLPKQYLFYLGSARGHKNLNRLMQAYSKVAKHHPEIGLVISGNNSFMTQTDRSLLKRLEQEGVNIIFTNWVSDREMSYLFAHAEAFIFPSLCEGFGIPILEAFYYGVPVLCSDNTVFPEVAADAAYYFDPQNVDSISDAIIHYLSMAPEAKEEMRQKGKARLNLFSWQHTADEVTKLLLSL